MDETILLDGINVCYRTEGQGEPLLLIHGMAFSCEAWGRTIKAASRFYTVYAPDLPGFGCSDKPAIDYGLDFYVDFMKKFLNALGIDRCAVAGMSMGGEIAAGLAARHPECVSRLVVVDAKGFSPLVKGIRARSVLGTPLYLSLFTSKGAFRRYVEGMVYDKSALQDELVEREWARIKDASYRRALSRNMKFLSEVDQGFAGILKSVKAKTLVIWGRDDTVLPLEDAYKFRDSIESAELVVIDRCGHVPAIERSDDLNRALLTFLGQVDFYYARE